MIRNKFLSLPALLLLLFSCDKENGTDTPGGEGNPDGSVYELAVSRSTADDIVRPAWEKGESIVVNGQVSEPLQNGTSGKATFTFEQPLTSPYAILSPVEAYKGEGKIFLPADQSYVVSASYGWYFPTVKPVTGALKIPAKGNMSHIYLKDDPACVQVKGNAGEQLHGIFFYDMKLGLFEGVRGLEQMGNCKPENSVYLPFIRNAVGPMEFTPGAMNSMQPNVYSARRPNSAGVGTRAHQMAHFVVFESGLQMLADNPTLYYRNDDCTRFMSSVPVLWDDTKVLAAKLGEYVVVAKRNGGNWFVGGIAGERNEPLDLEVSFDFLPEGQTFTLTSYEDGINADRQAMHYVKKEREVRKGDVVKIRMVRNGGYAAAIK